MKRVHIEASSNLAHLLRLNHEDKTAYFDRLCRAYKWLPMPQKRVESFFRLQPSPYFGWDVVHTSLLDELLTVLC